MGMTTKKAPPIRKDGMCAQCGGSREPKKPNPDASKTHKRALAEAQNDPFCSTECCRDYFGAREQEHIVRLTQQA